MSTAPPRRRAAVLGSPIRHSLSPVLHAAAYRLLELDWSYGAHEVDEPGLADFVAGLGPDWAGLSLTMPLKRAAIPLCTAVSGTAAAVSAVNTITFLGGERRGDNTDVPGLVNALAEVGVSHVPCAAVLGGGATAAAALAALAGLCDGRVDVFVRTPARSGELTAVAAQVGVEIAVRPWAEAQGALDAPLVFATTPAGGADALAGAVPERPAVLFDVVYDPWPTPLAAAWNARGGRLLSGLDLLVHQAVLQVELMTGRPLADPAAVVAAMRAAAVPVLAARRP